jgi:hypothetical protein
MLALKAYRRQTCPAWHVMVFCLNSRSVHSPLLVVLFMMVRTHHPSITHLSLCQTQGEKLNPPGAQPSRSSQGSREVYSRLPPPGQVRGKSREGFSGAEPMLISPKGQVGGQPNKVLITRLGEGDSSVRSRFKGTGEQLNCERLFPLLEVTDLRKEERGGQGLCLAGMRRTQKRAWPNHRDAMLPSPAMLGREAA